MGARGIQTRADSRARGRAGRGRVTDRCLLGIHIAGPSKAGQFAESWADMLLVKGPAHPEKSSDDYGT
jgi:hypothetical protein